MVNKFIPQMEPWFGEEEKNAICQYLSEGGWITEFKKTTSFEKMIKEYLKVKNCVVVNNGTISLTLGAIAIGIKAEDEILVPNYTMIASPNSLKMIGAKPVFVDVELETLCMDINLAKRAINSRTKALMLVTANGRYPQHSIKEFVDLCNDSNISLIEDSAQSLGSFYPDGHHQGTVGVFGSLSFSAPKIISTGQGGAIVTNDEGINYRLRRLKDFGRSEGGLDLHDSIGFNFKFTDLQACVGIEQMKKLDWRIQRKKQIYLLYKQNLSHISKIKFFLQDLEYTSPWFIDVLAEKRDKLQDFLKKRGIGSRVMYPPINKQIAYQVPGNYPVSDHVGQYGLWLPSSTRLTNDEIIYICDAINDFYNLN